MTDPDPVRAAQIANTYAQQFVLFRQQADRSKIAGAQGLVQQELAAPAALAALRLGRARRFRTARISWGCWRRSRPVTPRCATRQRSDLAIVAETKRNGMLGALLGLLLGIGLVFVAERLDRRIRDASELEEAYGVPVLGRVPESRLQAAGLEPLPARRERGVRASARPASLLQRRPRDAIPACDLCDPGRGQDDRGLNLAIAEAVAGNTKVVLLEADLRRPVARSAICDLTRGPGLPRF